MNNKTCTVHPINNNTCTHVYKSLNYLPSKLNYLVNLKYKLPLDLKA